MNDRYYIGTAAQPPPPDAAHFRTSALSREPAGSSEPARWREGALCVEMGFTWTFPRNQDVKVKLKSELISIKF